MPDYAAALRQLATDLIQDRAKGAEDIEDFDLRDYVENDEALCDLPWAEQDEAVETLKHLLRIAVTTVAWPEEELEPADEWGPGRWYRICRPDGTLWMETSVRREAEAEAKKTGWPLERLYVNNRSEWRSETAS